MEKKIIGIVLGTVLAYAAVAEVLKKVLTYEEK